MAFFFALNIFFPKKENYENKVLSERTENKNNKKPKINFRKT